jgi:ATP-binding cassette subfamily G (WHITE) protein 2
MELCSLAATSLALMISTFCRTITLSITVLPLILEVRQRLLPSPFFFYLLKLLCGTINQLCRLYGGGYLPPSRLPAYFSWLDALSFVKYSYTGIALNELEGKQHPPHYGLT